MKKLIVLIFASIILLTGCTLREKKQGSELQFADRWEFAGTAVEEQDYTIWGNSPLQTEDGKVHLFVARWPCELKVDPGWRSHSEIAHYVGEGPEGPFVFSDVALTPTGTDSWDSFGVHNPAIHKVGDKYIILYTSNNNPKRPAHPRNQKIGMVMADSPYGPWKRVGEDGLILSPPADSTFWNYKAGNGVNNPAMLQHPNGEFYLYFKSAKGKMGLAIAKKIEGPYVQLQHPVTSNDKRVEDGYAFIYNGKVALLTTDNHGIIEEGGGILWTSEDGLKFNHYEQGFKRINDYTNIDMSEVKVHYGDTERAYAKFERPQMLLQDGEPAYLYLPSGTNIYGGDCTISYVLKFKK